MGITGRMTPEIRLEEQEDKRELLYGQVLELFKSHSERVNVLQMRGRGREGGGEGERENCLLYTSDAADDWLVV